MKKRNELFIGFIMDENDYNFYVYLVNNSMDYFCEIKMLTGAYTTIDDDLLETGKVVKKKGALEPISFKLIDKSDWDELDFVIWYNLDLYDESGEVKRKYWFQLPKYGLGYKEKVKVLPVINKKGIYIHLEERNDKGIDEEIKNMNMGFYYYKYSS